MGISAPGPHDIVDALVADIRHIRPEILGLICTPETRAAGERLIAALGDELPRHELRLLPAAFDLNEAFEEVNAFIRDLAQQHNIAPGEIAINYTSGTKVMAAGALLSGVFHEVEALRYIQAGASRDGGSVAIVTDPRGVFLHRDAQLARRLARELRFMSACEILRGAERTAAARSPEDAGQMQRLRRLFEGFGAWDSLQYEAAIVAFRRATELPHEGGSEEFEPSLAIQHHLEAIVEAVDNSRFSPIILADLLNNAQRRLREEKANDASTRAYRCLEMLAHHKLRDAHGIDANNVDVRRVPPRSRDSFSAMRSTEDGRVRIGLRRSYELLHILRDPLGQFYSESNELREMLQARYKSILAHGVRSLTLAEARGFVRIVKTVIKTEFPEIEDTCQRIGFPWLTE